MQHDPLVSTDWLKQNMTDPDVVVLDASVVVGGTDPHGYGFKKDYRTQDAEGVGIQVGSKIFRSGLARYRDEGHVIGSRYADLLTEFSDPAAPLPFTRPTPAQFELAAGRLGITAKTHVVIYDRLANYWAARLWWVFTTLGHRNVSVLDGGYLKYVTDGGVSAHDFTDCAPTIYKISGSVTPAATKQDVINMMNHKYGHLVCLLQSDDFVGEGSTRSWPGHIPGSKNLPFSNLIDQTTNTLIERDQLREAFSTLIPLNGEPVIVYCGGGISSSLGALALAVLRQDNVLLYDGALGEWMNDPDLPLETRRTP